MPWKIAAFYKFHTLGNCPELKQSLVSLAETTKTVGSILLAPEGLNGTIAGQGDSVEQMLDYLRSLPGFQDLNAKWSEDQDQPFFRFKAKLKKQIISMGDFELTSGKQQGRHLNAAEWNRLLEDPDLVLVDTRNDYEVKVGTFQGAVDPKTKSFGEFPNWVEQNLDKVQHKKVAMFCTGGIRCEKASAYMLDQGFEQIFQLDGGILKYLEDTDEEQSKWLGECFVFDSRVTVNSNLEAGATSLCYACREPLAPEDLSHPDYEHGVSCQHCIGSTSEEQKQGFREREKQQTLAKQRNEQHLGKVLNLKGKRPQHS